MRSASGAPAGTIHRLDPGPHRCPARSRAAPHTPSAWRRRSSSARALGRLPPRLSVFGIEGGRFDAGDGLSPAVRAAVADVHRELQERLEGR